MGDAKQKALTAADILRMADSSNRTYTAMWRHWPDAVRAELDKVIDAVEKGAPATVRLAVELVKSHGCKCTEQAVYTYVRETRKRTSWRTSH